MTKTLSTVLLLALLLLLVRAESAQAAKAISVQIKDSEKVVLRGICTADDRDTPAEVWRELEQADLEALADFAAEPTDPRLATLMGDLRIVVSWHEPLASAAVSELHLVRDAGKGTRWRLAPGEVERAAPAAGLQLPSRAAAFWPLAVGVAVCVLAGV
ncbi:MAG: hypothetical protein JNM56_17870, partial [Planctomycetia bacterium]|nr:hypothetical protein [Planctomycetia bacterium]